MASSDEVSPISNQQSAMLNPSFPLFDPMCSARRGRAFEPRGLVIGKPRGA